jgi:hypothetical protein
MHPETKHTSFGVSGFLGDLPSASTKTPHTNQAEEDHEQSTKRIWPILSRFARQAEKLGDITHAENDIEHREYHHELQEHTGIRDSCAMDIVYADIEGVRDAPADPSLCKEERIENESSLLPVSDR